MWHPDTPIEYRNAIVTGDARVLSERIPDESVDLVLCDPVWWNIEDYAWLAKLATRVLTNNGTVVAQCGTQLVWQAEAAMRATAGALLHPQGVVAEVFTGGSMLLYYKRLVNGYHPYIVMSRNARVREGDWLHDCIRGGGLAKDVHAWGDSLAAYLHFVGRLTSGGSVVLDPFTGGGTVPAVCKMLGRNYIAFEIDPETAERARERVLLTQPPLFVQEPEQAALGI